MCGRFVASTPADVVASLFDVEETAVTDERPRFNVAPTDQVRTVVVREGVRWLEPRRWGLVPHWADSDADAAKRINARAETVAELPAYRDAFRRARCIVPADGFYEWRTRPDGSKQAYLIRPTEEPMFAFAGLRASWRGLDGPVRSCSIITTEANGPVRPVHDRMPAVLPADAWDRWLDPEEDDLGWLQGVLRPAPDASVELVPVGSAVNNVRNDGPHLVEPVPEADQGTLGL